MKTSIKDSRLAWLVLGAIFGVCVAYFWPHEPAYAMATDRDQRFAICTVEVGPGSPDAVFVLDFSTARLFGSMLNVQQGGFTQYWYANVNEDFQIPGRGDKAKYAIIPGSGYLNIGNQGGGGAGGTVATGLIYVAELTSGKVGCYRFTYRNNQGSEPTQLEPVHYFKFRDFQQK